MFEMNNEKRINCHLEGRSPRQDLINKCKDCNNEMEQKAYRASAKRDVYARSPKGSRLKLTTSMSCREAHKHRFLFNLIRRSPEFFAFAQVAPAKNRDDCFLFNKANESAHCVTNVTAPKQRSLDEVTCRAPRGMTFATLTLAAVLSMGTICESRAESDINCKNSQQSCGTNCCWSYDSNTNALTITGGADGSVGIMQSAPWNDYKSDMQNVSIDGITNIMGNAFSGYQAIKTVNIGNTIKNIENAAFLGDDKLENLTLGNSVEKIGSSAFQWTKISSVNFPDSLKSIAGLAFYGTRFTSIVIPDGTESIGNAAFSYGHQRIETLTLPDTVNLGEGVFGFSPYVNTEVICKGNKESCATIQSKIEPDLIYNNSKYNRINTFKISDEDLCNGAYYWNGIQCNNKKNGIICAENWKQIETWCNRIRYTPAEVAKVLKDDNTNEVTITFRK